MALSASVLANLIETTFRAPPYNANGTNLSRFCLAISTGVVNSIVGKSFITVDVGSVAGVGVGAGIGISGLVSNTMQTTALNTMTRQGPNAAKTMKVIMDSVVTHLGSATLVSADTPVFVGAGTITVGSIAVNVSEMQNNILIQLNGQGASGSNRSNLALAIATGIVNEILAAGTGTLVITGTPSGTPSPGVGAGTGTIS